MKKRTLKSSKKNESGQAIAELTIAMLAILAVLSGLLLIAQLGRTNIRTLLDAKAMCDINSINGIRFFSGSPIRYWTIGNDNLEMSPDDEAVTSTTEDSMYFRSQLTSNGFNIANFEDYVQNNFARDLSDGSLFFDSAELTSGRESVEVEFDDASRFLYGGDRLFGIPGVTIENNVYCPLISD